MFIVKSVGLFYLCFLAAVGVATSGWRRNITIDDLYGDDLTHIAPRYQPSDGWKLGGAVGSTKLNASLAHNQTWHDATHKVKDEPTTVNFGFTGVAIYLYCIIPNKLSGFLANPFADYQFVIDGDLVGHYIHIAAENGPAYLYNTTVYVNTTMENTFHNFSIVVDSTDKTVSLLFDYAIYSIEENPLEPSTTLAHTNPQPTDTPKAVDALASSQAVVVRLGAALGVLAFLIFIGITAYLLRTKLRNVGRQATMLSRWSGGPGDPRMAPETLPGLHY
ncbi:hypothetical protein AB1N83_011722 [Pleurotus pulmonarius]